MGETNTTIAVMMRDINSDFSEVMYSGLVDAAKEERPMSPTHFRINAFTIRQRNISTNLDRAPEYPRLIMFGRSFQLQALTDSLRGDLFCK